MFEYTPIWLNICGTYSGNSYTVNPWGRVAENYNSPVASQYGNLIYYATTSYSEKWGIGNIIYSSPSVYPLGKRKNNKYYWYALNESSQYNEKDYKYYWICLGYKE